MNCDFRAYKVCTDFRRGYCRGATNRSWAAKLGYYSHYAASSLRLSWDVWPFVLCTIM